MTFFGLYFIFKLRQMTLLYDVSTPIRPFNRGARLFSSFGNPILVQADASFSDRLRIADCESQIRLWSLVSL